MQLPITIKLNKPVKHGEAEIAELVFARKPVAGDLRGIRLGELDKADNLTTIIGRLTGQPPSVVQQLEFADFIACSEVITSFLPGGPRTGTGPAD